MTKTQSTKIQPFIQWAGGKRQLLEKLEAKIPDKYDTYYEPFVGGGALFLNIKPKNAVINDVNNQLINAYQQIKANPDDVIKIINKINKTQCNEQYYYAMRDKYNKKIQNKILDAECAALMIWLNKYCFNGLYRVNSKGLFNTSYNQKIKCDVIDEQNIQSISDYLQKHMIEIRNCDFEIACKDVKTGDFVYFDSPYVPVSETSNFTRYTKDGFTLDDHKRLAELFKKLDDIGAKLMLSNNDVPLVHKLYKNYKIENINAKRTINTVTSKRTGREVIVTNY